MGYYTQLTGAITITPPIEAGHRSVVLEFISTGVEWRLSEDGSLLLPPTDATKQGDDEFLHELITMCFVPYNYRLNGEIRWEGEETGDTGTLRIVSNKIEMLPDAPEPISADSIDEMLNLLKVRNGATIREAMDMILCYNVPLSGVVEILIGHLADGEMEVRWAAVDGLASLEDDADTAIPALTQALDDRYEWVRCAAAEALTFFGPKAIMAVPALKRLLHEPSYGLQGRAQEALESILGTSSTPQ